MIFTENGKFKQILVKLSYVNFINNRSVIAELFHA